MEDLKRKSRKVIGLALRQLLRMLREYPREPFLGAIAEAAQYGLYDLDRVERMILRRVQRDFFCWKETTMTDELEQLLRNLKLHRMHAIFDEQLRTADEQQITYSDFVADSCGRSGATARRTRSSGASAARACRNAGLWKRFLLPNSQV